MTTAAQILKSKPDKTVYTTTPAASVFDAVKLMADKNIGAVLVMEGDTLHGILSERDYARKGILQGHASKDTPVRQLMTARVFSVPPSWTAHQCMALMTEKRIRHLPVIDNGRLVGVISIGDVVRAVVEDQQFTINALNSYIATA